MTDRNEKKTAAICVHYEHIAEQQSNRELLSRDDTLGNLQANTTHRTLMKQLNLKMSTLLTNSTHGLEKKKRKKREEDRKEK